MSGWLRVRMVADRVVAAVLGVVTAPVVAVLALLVRRDGGPAFVRVPRIGQGGTRFAMHKLRTMRATESSGGAAGPPIASGDDDRITPFGARLRRLHVDELPQLWDVVRGRMLLFGPRPEAPELVDLDDRRWRAVLEVRPGIAGPTQLVADAWEARVLRGPDPVGRYRTVVLPVKLTVDDWYRRSASPWIDLLVVVSLFQRVCSRDAVTVIERLVHHELPEVAQATRRPTPIAWEAA